jgi:RHS repeat-associated protein
MMSMMIYRYGFNGKENDNDVKGEGNQQDYGMRIYDPRLGRFLSVDPITKEYPELTPYQFASNSPIENIDLDGLEKYTFHFLVNNGNKSLIKKETDNSVYYRKVSVFGLVLKPETAQYVYYEKKNSGKIVETNRSEELPFNPINIGGTLFVGADNPKINGKEVYKHEPLNLIDAAALEHDLAYNKLGASGPSDAFQNVKTIDADKTLLRKSKGVQTLYLNGY